MDNSQKNVLQEAKNIRAKYEPVKERSEDKMEKLRRLDKATEKPGTTAALTVGILSTLVLGFGMCCTMLWADRLFTPGVIIGILGLVGIAGAYPLYRQLVKMEKEKMKAELLQLADEIIKEFQESDQR